MSDPKGFQRLLDQGSDQSLTHLFVFLVGSMVWTTHLNYIIINELDRLDKHTGPGRHTQLCISIE